MKLLIRDYLASLRERDELDAILPDLLSELGYTVYSRPGRGTTQHGVDVAAVGTDSDGERKVFLFSIKRGDLTREEWDAPMQGLRSSLNEILDAYIPTRIPKRYSAYKIVICVCFGGDMQEQVRTQVKGFFDVNSNDRVSFDEWNGDRIAGLIMHGILGERVLPEALRSNFRKAVAMVDEPDVSFGHFQHVVGTLTAVSDGNKREQIRAFRQVYLCIWILYVWCRGANNLEAAYLGVERSVLSTWGAMLPLLSRNDSHARAMKVVADQLLRLYHQITRELVVEKIVPQSSVRHGLSVAVGSRSSTIVNMKLFDIVGRIGMYGIWSWWLVQLLPDAARTEAVAELRTLATSCKDLISNNPALCSPLQDSNVIDIGLMAMFFDLAGGDLAFIRVWFAAIVDRADLAYRSHGKYPCVYSAFRDLVEHPAVRTSEYLEEATSGSFLLVYLGAWLSAFRDEGVATIVALKQEVLQHCTLQVWLPDATTEAQCFRGGTGHGMAITDLSLEGDGSSMIKAIIQECDEDKWFESMGTIKAGIWPMLLLVSRHYRMPMPPQFWIRQLAPPVEP